MTDQSHSQTHQSTSTTTGVFALLRAKPGVTRERVMAVMPAEIRATVQLYLDGKIREWYSREDGRGGVFLLNTGDVAEAESIMESLPLAKENMLDHEYIPVGPLMPLRLLMGASLRKEAPRLCRGGSRSLTFKAVVHRRDSRFVSHHAHEGEFRDGRLRKPKPQQVGVQIPCGVHSQVSQKDAVRGAEEASGGSVSQVGGAEGKQDRRGASHA
jgi:hypothetical protein